MYYFDKSIIYLIDFIGALFMDSQRYIQNLVNLPEAATEVFYKKGVLKNLLKFTGKHCVRVSFLIKLRASACNFIKKEIQEQVFSCEFCEIFKSTFF